MSTQVALGNTKPWSPKSQRQPVAPSSASHEGLVDLEFSDSARDERFLPGWWIAPGVVFGVAFMLSVAAYLTR